MTNYINPLCILRGTCPIDIYVLSEPSKFGKRLPTLEKLFGKPKSTHDTFIEWSFTEIGYSIKLYLTEPPERQIRVYEILKSNKELLKENEDLKLKFSDKSFRDYQRAKYEFYSKILNL